MMVITDESSVGTVVNLQDGRDPGAFTSETFDNIVKEVFVGQRKHLQTRLMLKEGRMGHFAQFFVQMLQLHFISLQILLPCMNFALLA